MRHDILRRAWPLAALIAATLVAGFVACSDDGSPAGPEQADVDSYLNSLPTWNEFSPRLDDEQTEGNPTASIDWDQQQICKTTECSITRTPEDIVTYNPNSELLYLGSLIQGKTYIGGLGSLEELPIRQRAPLTISIDLHTPNSSRTVANPSLSTMQDAIHDLVAEAVDAGYKAGSSIYFSQVTCHSLEQSTLQLGMSAKYMGVSVKANLRASTSTETNTVTAFFVQRMFTTSVELPQTPGEFFSAEFTRDHLNDQIEMGRIGPDNLPVFVSNIVWGRMMTLTMTSTEHADTIQAALRASYNNIGGSISARHLSIIQNSVIKLATVGGDDQAARDYLTSGNLGDYFAVDSELTTAVPLSYTLRNLGNNSIAMVSETTDYDIVECQPLVVTLLPDEPTWRNEVLTAGMTIHEFPFSSTNIGLATELPGPPSSNDWISPILTFPQAATGFPFDFHIEATSAPSMTWNDDEMPRGEFLSIGDADNYENDDFDIAVTDTTVYAMYIYVGDNGFAPEEYLEVWATDGFAGERYLRQFPYGDLSAHIAVISPVPIRRIHFNEDVGGDDIFIANLLLASKP